MNKQGLGSQTSGANGVWWRTGVAQVYSLVAQDWGNPVSYSRRRLENIKTQGWIRLPTKNVVVTLFPLPHCK